MQYTITRICLFDDNEVQVVVQRQISDFPLAFIPFHDARYRACLLEYDELVELPFDVGYNGEFYLDYTPMSQADQRRYEIRHKIGPTDPSPLIGTLREEPDSVPTNRELIDMLNTLCIRMGEHSTIPFESTYCHSDDGVFPIFRDDIISYHSV